MTRLVPVQVSGESSIRQALPDRQRVDLRSAVNLRDKLNDLQARSAVTAAYNDASDDFTIYRIKDVLSGRSLYLVAQKGFSPVGEVIA